MVKYQVVAVVKSMYGSGWFIGRLDIQSSISLFCYLIACHGVK